VFPKTFLKHLWSQPHPNHPNLPFGHQLLHIPKSLNLLKTKGQRSNILKQICFWNFEAQNPQHSQDYDLKIEPSGKKIRTKSSNKYLQQVITGWEWSLGWTSSPGPAPFGAPGSPTWPRARRMASAAVLSPGARNPAPRASRGALRMGWITINT
jgi:hypothetical protein